MPLCQFAWMTERSLSIEEAETFMTRILSLSCKDRHSGWSEGRPELLASAGVSPVSIVSKSYYARRLAVVESSNWLKRLLERSRIPYQAFPRSSTVACIRKLLIQTVIQVLGSV
uniref:Uncharacterized protein n=1 Tax=Physcomitrium patens TaxID=3218 RepID=A9T4I0_PHYPA|nr:hypothetical protein PHYPA_001852 [Physcomitrium patens]